MRRSSLPLSLFSVLLPLLFLLSSPLLLGCSALWLPNLFDSNMVLQRAPQSARIWGSAAPSSVVKVVLDSTLTFGTFADADGNWTVELAPQPASAANHTLLVAGDGETREWTNVAFGDVYLCSGQSNIDFALRDAFNATAAIADSINYPNLRLYTVAKVAAPDAPVNDTTTRFVNGSNWMVSSPDAVDGPSWDYYSAVCYFFASALYRDLGGQVPLGVIETAWGGTRVETWTSPDGIAACGAPTPANASNPDPDVPSELWNGMVAPLSNLRVTGTVWYQGESNVLNATGYACRFPAMIVDWRNHFDNPQLYFSFVLLAAFKDGGADWAPTREAQLQALQLPYVSVASAQDLGDDLSPFGGIHPRNKTLVGERLALDMLVNVYGRSDVLSVGPMFDDIVWPLAGSPLQTVILRFRSDDPSAQALHLDGTSGCSACCSAAGSPIALTLSDGSLQLATVSVLPDEYLVTATVDLSTRSGKSAHSSGGGDAALAVTGVQLNWVPYPECSLYNSAELPHLPINVPRW